MESISSSALSNNAIAVLEHRYLLKDKNGIETPVELFQRVAKAIASAEKKWGTVKDAEEWENKFFEWMSGLYFLPNSPTLMNAGTLLNQLSACFVLPVEDSLEEIFTTLKQAALVQQSGGGTGFNFSHLRPKGDILHLTNGTASGPVSFMKVFDAATEHIKHGGKRRGANMGILNVDHPDIMEFIQAKTDDDSLHNFNLSVGITDEFMKAVEANQSWPLKHPGTNNVIRKIKAQELWNRIIECAWQSGDPGLVFLDTVNHKNPLASLGRIEATNPCGEVPLLPYESCNLGSINLSRFVNNRMIDWQKLEEVTHMAVRFLDDVVTVNNYVIPATESMVHQNRKIGLGVMGWADMLVLMQIPYDSDAALALGGRVMEFISQRAIEASTALALKRGSFPNWNKSIYYPHRPMRNATLLSIAPTGTISIIADCSSSIEPLFALAYQRKQVLNGQSLPEVNRHFLDYIREFDLYSPQLLEAVKKTGTIANIDSLPADIKTVFKTAMEIDPAWHLKHQVVFQKYVDNAVSKTINLPYSATREDVARIYRRAWEEKTKGITIFRDQSKRLQVLEQGISGEAQACKTCVIA